MQIYGTPLPPEYNFSNILTKIHIMYGTNDWLIPAAVSVIAISDDLLGVEWLASQSNLS